MKSFGNRESRARFLLERLRERNVSKTEALEQRIKQAKSTGFHNLKLALKLWDEILMVDFNGGVHDEVSLTEAPDK